jgi:hypothetical protein
MDARARFALEEACRHALASDLDEIVSRLEALERRAETPAPRRREYVALRIRTAADMRRRGLTFDEIAARLGVVRATVQRDVAAEAAARQNGNRASA